MAETLTEDKETPQESTPQKYVIPGYEDLGEFDTQEDAMRALSKRLKDTQRAYHDARNQVSYYEEAQKTIPSLETKETKEETGLDYDPYDPDSQKRAFKKMDDRLKRMDERMGQMSTPPARDPYQVERELQVAKEKVDDLKDDMIYGRVRDGLHKYKLDTLQKALATIYPHIMSWSPVEFALLVDKIGTGKVDISKKPSLSESEKGSGRKEVSEASPYTSHATPGMIKEYEEIIKPTLLKEGKSLKDIEALFKGKLLK